MAAARALLTDANNFIHPLINLAVLAVKASVQHLDRETMRAQHVVRASPRLGQCVPKSMAGKNVIMTALGQKHEVPSRLMHVTVLLRSSASFHLLYSLVLIP